MNLEDVIDSEYGLQQDDYSLSGVVFGEEGQLECFKVQQVKYDL